MCACACVCINWFYSYVRLYPALFMGFISRKMDE